MTRESYHRELRELRFEAARLGRMVDRAVGRAMLALEQGDSDAARAVIADDREINVTRFAIEDRCIDLIATQTPVADDLRVIVAVLNVIVDLERMGDHAAGIAEIAARDGASPPIGLPPPFGAMAAAARDMLRGAIDALVTLDGDLARRVVAQDDQVDTLHDQVFGLMLAEMAANPRLIARATHLLWVSHNLERIGDRATNICERVLFVVTGRMEEVGASRY